MLKGQRVDLSFIGGSVANVFSCFSSPGLSVICCLACNMAVLILAGQPVSLSFIGGSITEGGRDTGRAARERARQGGQQPGGGRGALP